MEIRKRIENNVTEVFAKPGEPPSPLGRSRGVVNYHYHQHRHRQNLSVALVSKSATILS